MRNDTVVHVHIDAVNMERAAAALAAMGLSVSDAIRPLMLRVADEQRLLFDLKVPNSVTIEAMKEPDAGRGRRPESPEELFSDLDI